MTSGIKETISAVKDQLVLAEKVQRNKEDIAKLEKELETLKKDVSNFFEKVEVLLGKHFEMVEREIQNVHEKEAANRKIALLELENKFLKSEKSLPSGEEKK